MESSWKRKLSLIMRIKNELKQKDDDDRQVSNPRGVTRVLNNPLKSF